MHLSTQLGHQLIINNDCKTTIILPIRYMLAVSAHNVCTTFFFFFTILMFLNQYINDNHP